MASLTRFRAASHVLMITEAFFDCRFRNGRGSLSAGWIGAVGRALLKAPSRTEAGLVNIRSGGGGWALPALLRGNRTSGRSASLDDREAAEELSHGTNRRLRPRGSGTVLMFYPLTTTPPPLA